MDGPRVIFEDSDILAINKPYGMVVNRADTTKNVVTVQEWAEEKLKVKSLRLKVEEESEFEKRGGVVHRLDRETSGVLIIAKNEESFNNIKEQFMGRTVKKTYLTLVHGEITPAVGEINVPLGRLPWNRTRFGVLAEGRPAISRYKVLDVKYKKWDPKTFEPLSLVEVYPLTGRTHQIRVHMKHIGHPVFSDELYAGRKVSKRDRKILPRQFLHASKLSIHHPRSGESVTFEAGLPTDLQTFLGTLDVRSGNL